MNNAFDAGVMAFRPVSAGAWQSAEDREADFARAKSERLSRRAAAAQKQAAELERVAVEAKEPSAKKTAAERAAATKAATDAAKASTAALKVAGAAKKDAEDKAKVAADASKKLLEGLAPLTRKANEPGACLGTVADGAMSFGSAALPCLMAALGKADGGSRSIHTIAQDGRPPKAAQCLESKGGVADDANGLRFTVTPAKAVIRVRDTGTDFALIGGDFIHWNGEKFALVESTLPANYRDAICDPAKSASALVATKSPAGPYVVARADFKVEQAKSTIAVQATADTWCEGETVADGGLGEARSCGWGDDVCTICIDLTGGTPRVIQAPNRNVLRPNQGVRVVLKHDLETKATLALSGTATLTSAATIGATTQQRGTQSLPAPAPIGILKRGGPETLDAHQLQEMLCAALATLTPDFLVTTQTYAPRATGATKLEVSSKQVTVCKQAAQEVKVELGLIVDTLSWGAVRTGVGAVFFDAASPEYEIRTLPGSQQAEIVKTADLGVNFEMVVGFSPYIIDLLAWGGRSHTGGGNAWVAPYVGFGLIGQTGTSVSAFGSLHLGVEVEASPGFSIAPTFVVRRTNALIDGLSAGSPASDGDNITSASTGIGFGILVNATPEFLRFSAPSAGAAATGSSTATPSTTEK